MLRRMPDVGRAILLAVLCGHSVLCHPCSEEEKQSEDYSEEYCQRFGWKDSKTGTVPAVNASTWETAVTNVFGEDVLKAKAKLKDGKANAKEIPDWGEEKEKQKYEAGGGVPPPTGTKAPPTRTRAPPAGTKAPQAGTEKKGESHSPTEWDKNPGYRAISLANLEKVMEFLEEIGTPGDPTSMSGTHEEVKYIPNTDGRNKQVCEDDVTKNFNQRPELLAWHGCTESAPITYKKGDTDLEQGKVGGKNKEKETGTRGVLHEGAGTICADLCNAIEKPQQMSVRDPVVKGRVNMHVINSQLILPLTKATGLSFVGHVGGSDPDHFISHNWAGSFEGFLTAVQAHFKATYTDSGETEKSERKKEDVFYWICTFANNQHNAAAELGNSPETGPFAKAIETVKRKKGETLAIQDDLLSPAASASFTLTRAWCVFEMAVTLENQMPLVFGCSNGALLRMIDGNGNKVGTYADDKQCSCLMTRQLQDWKVKDASCQDCKRNSWDGRFKECQECPDYLSHDSKNTHHCKTKCQNDKEKIVEHIKSNKLAKCPIEGVGKLAANGCPFGFENCEKCPGVCQWKAGKCESKLKEECLPKKVALSEAVETKQKERCAKANEISDALQKQVKQARLWKKARARHGSETDTKPKCKSLTEPETLMSEELEELFSDAIEKKILTLKGAENARKKVRCREKNEAFYVKKYSLLNNEKVLSEREITKKSGISLAKRTQIAGAFVSATEDEDGKTQQAKKKLLKDLKDGKAQAAQHTNTAPEAGFLQVADMMGDLQWDAIYAAQKMRWNTETEDKQCGVIHC